MRHKDLLPLWFTITFQLDTRLFGFSSKPFGLQMESDVDTLKLSTLWKTYMFICLR